MSNFIELIQMNADPVYYRYEVDAAYHISFLALSIRYLENNKKIVSNNTFSFATSNFWPIWLNLIH